MRTLLKMLLAAVATAHCLALPAHAADPYPIRPIRMVVAFAAGGSADINARIFAQELGKELGQSVVVDNKGGAGGNLGAVEVKRAMADGYTLFYGTSAIVLAPALYKSPGFDPYSDFVPISLTATVPLVLVVHPSVPAKTATELVAYGKANPGKLNYGSSGTGALLHLAGALFTSETGIKATHIAYKGSAPAVADLVGGTTQMMFLPLSEASAHVKSRSLRALAITHPTRSSLLPDVPTIREATSMKNMDMGAWQGLMLPKGAPKDVVAKVENALKKSLADPSLRERLSSNGSIVLGGTQKEYSDYMKAEGARWAKVVKDTGASAD